MIVNWIHPLPSNVKDVRYGSMCALCSAVVMEHSRTHHEQFHNQYLLKSELQTMSSAAWCDPGSHAFKAGEAGSQSFTGTSIGDDGTPQRMEMDACAEHSFQQMEVDRKQIQDH